MRSITSKSSQAMRSRFPAGKRGGLGRGQRRVAVDSTLDPASDPRQVQLRLLREVRRCLKPHGVVLAVENGWHHKRLKGHAVDVAARVSGSVRNRLTNDFNRHAPGQTCRKYLHSYFGYRKLLHEVGFKQVRFYVLMPGCIRLRSTSTASTARHCMSYSVNITRRCLVSEPSRRSPTHCECRISGLISKPRSTSKPNRREPRSHRSGGFFRILPSSAEGSMPRC